MAVAMWLWVEASVDLGVGVNLVWVGGWVGGWMKVYG